MEKKYRIGEFAKNLGVSIGFLKHHEQDGILRPEVSESGYRYYSYSQAFQVLQCLRLQSLGFDSREIAGLLNHSRDLDIEALYAGKREEIEARIRYDSEIVKHLKALEREGLGRDQDGKWRIEEVPPFFYMEHSQNGIFYEDEDCCQVIKHWNQFLPMILTCQRIEWEEDEKVSAGDNVKGCYGGLMINKKHAEKLGLLLNRAVREVVPGQCLNYHRERIITHPSADEKENNAARLKEPIRLCQDHHFIPRGDIYVAQSFISLAGDENYVSEVIIIPLEV